METIDKAKFDLQALETSRQKVSDALLSANQLLIKANIFERGRIKDAIRNYEQELKKLDKLIKDKSNDIVKLEKSQDKFDSKTEAYKSGIDPNKAWSDAISSGLGSVSSAVTSIVSPFSGSPKKVLEGSEPIPALPGYMNNDPFKGTPAAKNPKDWYIVYIAIAAFVLYKLFKK